MEIKLRRGIIAMIMAPVVALTTAGAADYITTFDFNDGFQGWLPQTTGRLEWKVADLDEIVEGKGFSSIDSEDRGSLYAKAPLLEEDRTKSHITSPEIYLGSDPRISFYAAYSSFYDPFCRLQLQISSDDFKTQSVIWNSKNYDFPTWDWRLIELSLEKYAGRNVKLRFFYTTGANKALEDRGGYFGDFAIDYITITSTSQDVPDDEPGGGTENPSPGNNPDEENPTVNPEPDSNGMSSVGADTEPVRLFNLEGKEIKFTDTSAPSFGLPHGVYILKRAGRTVKIVL